MVWFCKNYAWKNKKNKKENSMNILTIFWISWKAAELRLSWDVLKSTKIRMQDLTCVRFDFLKTWQDLILK